MDFFATSVKLVRIRNILATDSSTHMRHGLK